MHEGACGPDAQQEEEEQERQKLVAKQAQDLQEADEVRKSKETQKAEQKKVSLSLAMVEFRRSSMRCKEWKHAQTTSG